MSEEAWTGLTWAFLVNVRGVAKAAECSVLAPNDCAVIWGAQALLQEIWLQNEVNAVVSITISSIFSLSGDSLLLPASLYQQG